MGNKIKYDKDFRICTQAQVRQLFDYRDGHLIWKISRGNARVGAVAGFIYPEGYRGVGFNGKQYKVHRLIFLHHFGFLPPCIDHIDGNKINNRIDNLRPATQAENCRNTKKRSPRASKTSKWKGVIWNKKAKKWVVCVRGNGVGIHLGSFVDESDAAMVYNEAALLYHGDFARLNNCNDQWEVYI